ncbi:MAG: hypothetical protein JOZ82_10350, partial [Marmoricola sp.]|nr:hypothetical protein [Marmoricola sp.]
LGATPTDTQSRGLQLDGGPEDVVLATVAAAVDLLGRALTETAPDIDREAPR